MEFKKTEQLNSKIKGLRIIDNAFVDEDGENVNLLQILKAAYGMTPFDLSVTSKQEELIEMSAPEDDEDNE